VRKGGGVLELRRPALVLVMLLFYAAASPATAPATGPAGLSVVAQARGLTVAAFRSPGSRHPFRSFRNPTADGSPLVFLVMRRVPGWEQVRLPTRPNGSVGWVRTGSVTLAWNAYRITVSLRRHRLTVWRSGRAISHDPVVVGRASLPTPTGTYYIAELLKQANPHGSYGPYAFGLSAHSDVLYSFGGGPGQIGIHGTNEPRLLGTDASHGCIRVGNAVITRLARTLPLGTPVVISRS
jgi:lipoprotein-anchoring transpeptidase ErfK/SrfK